MSFVQLIDKGDKVMLGWKTHAQKKYCMSTTYFTYLWFKLVERLVPGKIHTYRIAKFNLTISNLDMPNAKRPSLFDKFSFADLLILYTWYLFK